MEKKEKIEDLEEELAKAESTVIVEEEDTESIEQDPNIEEIDDDAYPESFPASITTPSDVMMKVLEKEDTERFAFLDKDEVSQVRDMKNVAQLCAFLKHPVAGAFIKQRARTIEGTSLSKEGKLLDTLVTLKRVEKRNYPPIPQSQQPKKKWSAFKIFSRKNKQAKEGEEM